MTLFIIIKSKLWKIYNIMVNKKYRPQLKTFDAYQVELNSSNHKTYPEEYVNN